MPNYRQVFPDSVKSQYNPNETVQFSLSFLNEALLAGSVRVSGDLEITSGGGGDDMYDVQVGIHSVWSSINVSFAKMGMVQSLLQPARFQKMVVQGLESQGEQISSSSNSVALKLARQNQCADFIKGVEGTAKLPFVCALTCLLNTAPVGTPIPFSKTGLIQVNLRTASIYEFLTSESSGTGQTYKLSNLALHYQTASANSVKSSSPLRFRTFYSVKAIVDSSLHSSNIRVPSRCQSVSISFVPTANENVVNHNTLQCDFPTGLKSVQYGLNDGIDVFQRYTLENREEWLLNYKQSLLPFGNTPYNQLRLREIVQDDREFGLGLRFGSGDGYSVDLTNQPLNFNMESTISNANPHAVYFFFQGVVSL